MAHARYTVVRKLAEGGMAEIFLARQHGSEGFEKPVVLKRIHTAFYADEQFRNMLVDEAHISMGLHHNNIVQVLDLGRAGGRLFLVLELVDGWDLSRVLERARVVRQGLPVGLGLYVMVDVCRALAYAHGRTGPEGEAMGIVHRDVSPQNVLLSEQGEVKLADFGIAKALTKRDRTATGVVKGKVAFMSPEQALGQPIDARSDLFSLGVMLYLLATGVRPFEAGTDFEVLVRVQKGIYTPAEEVRPDLSPALAAIIHRSLRREREDRYQTADELLADLEGVWRSEWGAPGQTELKLWLAELGRRDGIPAIGRWRPPEVPMAVNDAGSGDLQAGAALVLGEEGSLDGSSARFPLGEVTGERLELDEPLGGIDTFAALEDTNPAAAVTQVARGATPARRARPIRPVSGIEATTVKDLDLSLGLGTESSEMIHRLRGGSRKRAMGTGFFLLILLAGGAAAAIWRLSVNREAAEGESVAAPVTSKPAVSEPRPSPPLRRESRASEGGKEAERRRGTHEVPTVVPPPVREPARPIGALPDDRGTKPVVIPRPPEETPPPAAAPAATEPSPTAPPPAEQPAMPSQEPAQDPAAAAPPPSSEPAPAKPEDPAPSTEPAPPPQEPAPAAPN